MALYKNPDDLERNSSDAFDQINEPSTSAPWPGIYKCIACGHEIAIAAGHALPPQNHHQHRPGIGRIRWQLVVSHKKY